MMMSSIREMKSRMYAADAYRCFMSTSSITIFVPAGVATGFFSSVILWASRDKTCPKKIIPIIRVTTA